ncbi:C6 zinc finger domain protein [Rutstroemia sp. NJR-2017a BBW]|nr:C6 zinc finger domain protein [Rutstroemia sp. NJR-2017a BBW]
MAQSSSSTNKPLRASTPKAPSSTSNKSLSESKKQRPRYRNCGTPVRTGCRTCKIRRVKCDEDKPFCKKCTSTGRSCDGYEILADLKKKTLAKKSPSISLELAYIVVEDPMEQQMLDFFRTFTAPELSGNFAVEFWEKRILQAATIEPSIRHITLALGAIHKHYCERHQKSVPYDGLTQAFAFRQYSKAISTLRNSIVKDSQSLDVTLISCILLICFDCLVEDHTSAMVHLNSGLRILDDIHALSASSTIASRCAIDYSPLLLAVGICAVADPNNTIPRRTCWGILKRIGTPLRSAPFESLEDARYALQTLGIDVLSQRFSTMFDSEDDMVLTPFGPMGHSHHVALQDWHQRFENFTQDFPSDTNDSTHAKHVAASFLRTQYHLFCMNATEPHSLERNFEEMLNLSEKLILSCSSPKSMPRLMVDTGVIVPLTYTAFKSPQLEHKIRANELLLRAPGREGLWNTDVALRLVEEELSVARKGAHHVSIS